MQHSWLLSPCPSRRSLGGGTELVAQPVLGKLSALGTLFLHPVCFTAAPNTWGPCALLVTGWVSVCFCTLWSEAAAPSVSEQRWGLTSWQLPSWNSLLILPRARMGMCDASLYVSDLAYITRVWQWPWQWIESSFFFGGGGRKVEPCEGPSL